MTAICVGHAMQDVGVVHRSCVPYDPHKPLSVEDIASRFYNGCEGLRAWVRAPFGHDVEWVEMPRDMWRWVKPKTGDSIRYTYRPAGGSVGRTLFAVASIVAVIAAPYLAPAIFAGGLTGALATAALGAGLSYLGNALFPVQSAATAPLSSASDADSQKAKAFANVETDSNLLAKESYLPVVLGERRLSPPELTYPLLRLENGVQTVSRIFALDGQHEVSDIHVDRVPVSDFSSIETEIHDGAETSPVTTDYVTSVNNTINVSETLSTFSVDDTSLVDQETPANSEPRWVRFTTASDDKMEEIILRLQLSSFIKSDSATGKIRVPLRIRFRPKGSSGAWNNLPEIHLVGRDISTSLKEIRIRWDGQFGASDTGGEIAYEFFQQVPEVTAYTLSDGSSGDQWQADAHFVADTGLRDVQNIAGRRNGVQITLDETLYPKQAYEWEIKRGLSSTNTELNNSNYVLGGQVNSLFVARYDSGSAEWRVPVDQGAYTAALTASLATTIIGRQPCQRPRTAIIGLKATGQSTRNVTCLAKRYIYDWDGTGWNTLTTTKNPAVHYRQVAYDWLVYNGVDTSLITDSDFVAWRAECIARGYEVSAVVAGSSVDETLGRIATAGFARRRYSDGFGVDYFRDRSSERPVQSFSPRNATISIDWDFTQTTAGLRAKYQDESDSYRDNEIQVPNFIYQNVARYDVIEYDMIANADLVRRRATFDMLQAHYQGRRTITVETATEGLVCERGDLVTVVTDLLNDDNSGARIRSVIDSANFTIDQLIPAQSTESLFDADNIFSESDIFVTGEQTVCLISTETGTIEADVVAAEGNLVRIGSALPSLDVEGAHIVFGPRSKFANRCVVMGVQRLSQERSRVTLVDEAPEIFEKMQELFG